ncbi:MAG: Trk system potassium transporter TrkA [Alphaproteobacteria bacterium]|nr:MAG: Trk system potassium transporter TrkA [Alphaproteobacteria bacterium]
MKVIICGAGRVGTSIAKRLAEQRNDVTVIDRSVALTRTIAESLDVRAIAGHASDPEILDQANAADADMIIAVTQSDEVNMVACQIAHSLFDVPTKIARIRNQNYLLPAWADMFSRDNLPIDVIISPEIEVAHAIHHRIQVPGAFDIAPFCDDLVRVIGIVLDKDCPVLDTPLRQLDALFPDLNITVMGIHRGERTIVPSADDLMLVGDRVYFAVETAHVGRALAVFGLEEKPINRVIIVGGGNVGRYLAADIIEHDSNMRVAVIEPDSERASLVADRVPSAIVINGSALDADVLHEASVAEADIIVAVANDDEVNILGSLLAKRHGARRAITLINNPTFSHLVGPLGIDVVIDPRDTTVSTILQEIRRGRIRGVYSLDAGRAEVLEAEALDTSPLVGRSVGKARLPDGIIFGAIIRDGRVIVPRADTVIQARDRIIVFALEHAVANVEQLFAVRLEFF